MRAPAHGRRSLVAAMVLKAVSLAFLTAVGCSPIPPDVAAEAVVDGPVEGRALLRALEADPAVADVRANPYGRHESTAAAQRPPGDYLFTMPAYAEAWGQLSAETSGRRSTRVRARVSWPTNGVPSYRQQAEMEDLVRRLVGRVLMSPADPAAPPAASPAAIPPGPGYWSGGR